MLTMFLRATVLYLFVIGTMRCMGKRQIGQMQPYELVLTMLVADLAAVPMGSSSVPLLYGIMPIAALVLMQSLMTLLILKSHRLREFLSGKPSILVRNGVVDEKELRRQTITLAELMEETRIAGIASLRDVGCAILEVSGDVTVFPISQKRPATPADLQLKTGYEGMSMALVLDGAIQQRNLARVGKDEAWLHRQLDLFSAKAHEVFLCLLDTTGDISVQIKGQNEARSKKILSAKEVIW